MDQLKIQLNLLNPEIRQIFVAFIGQVRINQNKGSSVLICPQCNYRFEMSAAGIRQIQVHLEEHRVAIPAAAQEQGEEFQPVRPWEMG